MVARIRHQPTFAQMVIAPTEEHYRNARRISSLVNDPTAPDLIRDALLSLLVEAAEVTGGEVARVKLFEVADPELQVNVREVAQLLFTVERDGLRFERGGIVDAKGEFKQVRK